MCSWAFVYLHLLAVFLHANYLDAFVHDHFSLHIGVDCKDSEIVFVQYMVIFGTLLFK